MMTVCTVLPPLERARLDAAGDGCFTALHVDSFHDVLNAARRQQVDALVISVHRCGGVELPAVARFVHEFPAIPAVALVSRHDSDATETLLRLGATGVRAAVDCTEPGGWRRLRELVGHPASPAAGQVLARVLPALRDVPDDTRLFFEALTRLAPVLTRCGDSLSTSGVGQTLMSRSTGGCLTTKLPGRSRLLPPSTVSESRAVSGRCCLSVDYSSPQSFSRHLKAMLGVTAGEYRKRFPFDVALARFIDLLIIPYREALRALHPLNAGNWDQGPDAARVSRRDDQSAAVRSG